MQKIRSALLLVLAAFIWGAAFTAQTVGMEYIGPYTFNASRFLIGGLVLLPVILIRRKLMSRREALSEEASTNKNAVSGVPGNMVCSKQQPSKEQTLCSKQQPSKEQPLCSKQQPSGKGLLKKTILSGIICGTVLATASCFQQIGLLYTAPGKAGFITALYVILVPVCGLFLGRKSTWLLYVSAALAVVGMYFLCLSESFSLNFGDILVFICAIFFTMHILVIDKLAPDVDGVELSCVQFFTAGIICTILTLIFEFPFGGETGSIGGFFSSILDGALPILYAGALSCGVAYTLQIIGQKKTHPVVASLLLSLESVFSVIAAWIILGDKLSAREIIGCCIVFAAIVLAQLPIGKKKNDR